LPPAAKNPFEKGFLDLPKLFNWDGLDTVFFFVSLCVLLWLKTDGGFWPGDAVASFFAFFYNIAMFKIAKDKTGG